jgi:hypothetical protein
MTHEIKDTIALTILLFKPMHNLYTLKSHINPYPANVEYRVSS